jgi:hypothetical protein
MFKSPASARNFLSGFSRPKNWYPRPELNRVLSRDLVRECGAVREVSMDNLFQFRMRNAEFSAPDGRHALDGWMIECVLKGVSAHHSSRAHDYKLCLAISRNIHSRLRCFATAFTTFSLVKSCDDSACSSSQSTLPGFAGTASTLLPPSSHEDVRSRFARPVRSR